MCRAVRASLVVYRFDEVGESMCGVGAHPRQDVLVGGHREAGVCVTEALGHDFDRYAGCDEQRGVGVSKVVESYAREFAAGHGAVKELTD